MSRTYHLVMHVRDFQKSHVGDLEDAARKLWPFDTWDPNAHEIYASGIGSLCMGESEEEFSRMMKQALYKANGEPCIVDIHLTCLEYGPSYEEY